MAKPYDAATKRLLDLRPADWLPFLGLPEGPVTVLDSDLSTITSVADRLARVDAPSPYAHHLEFVSGKDGASMPGRTLVYNVNAEEKLGLPIFSTLCLLHPRSDSSRVTGELIKIGPDGEPYHIFRYRVLRVWQEDVERFLTGGIGLLPFAPLSRTPKKNLGAVVDRMKARIDAEIHDDQEAEEFWSAAYILTALRYNDSEADRALARQVFRRVSRMQESWAYQEILAEGRAEGVALGLAEGFAEGRAEGVVLGRAEGEARGELKALIRVGKKRFGEPSPRIVAALEAITSTETLETLLDRVTEVESWDDLLALLP